MTEIDEAVAVWTTDEGIPTRLMWRSFGEHRYTTGSLPREIGGWRFQGTSEDGIAHMFDVQHDTADRSWRLVRVFD